MAIGVVHGCDGCIASHAAMVPPEPAPPSKEAAEAIGVAIMMNGGPATIYGARLTRRSRSSPTPGGELGPLAGSAATIGVSTPSARGRMRPQGCRSGHRGPAAPR